MSIKVLDNFLQSYHYNTLCSIITERIFWKWTPDITQRGVYNENDRGQFIHMFYDANIGILSNTFQDLNPIIENLSMIFGGESRSIILYRIKANLNPRESDNYQLGDYHVDFDFNCKTGIYYLNTNNGYTKFSDGTIINSVANRMVVFNSDMKHVGFTCSDEKCRLLMNINFATPNK